MSKTAVLFLSYTDDLGLLFHFTKFIPYLLRECDPDIEFHMAAPAYEQHPGLWDALRKEVPSSRIVVLPHVADAAAAADRMLQDSQKLIVHCHGIRQVLQMIPLKKRYGDRVELVVTVHSFRNGTWRQFPTSFWAARYFARYVSRVVFPSAFAMRHFACSANLARMGKVAVIPLGVEEPTEAELQTPSCALGEPDIRPCLTDPGLACLVYLARFDRVKRHRWMIRTLAPVLCARPGSRLLLLGDGELLDDVKAMVAGMGLSRQVLIPGRIDRSHVPWVLTKARAALSLSRSETFGHSVAEPMAMGCPVIATRVGAAEWAMNYFVTGLGVGQQDGAGVARWVDLLLSNQKLAQDIGHRGQSLARMLFSWPLVATAYVRLYRAMLGLPMAPDRSEARDDAGGAEPSDAPPGASERTMPPIDAQGQRQFEIHAEG